ncbi:hypothetical protein VNO77_01999 [Canavalia gladiata]|uniref:Uncharacterized protein n=1 Tax=Canavalia gladiata TaxID=3824 RepID=A0AAN9MSU2_CANGL
MFPLTRISSDTLFHSTTPSPTNSLHSKDNTNIWFWMRHMALSYTFSESRIIELHWHQFLFCFASCMDAVSRTQSPSTAKLLEAQTGKASSSTEFQKEMPCASSGIVLYGAIVN